MAHITPTDAFQRDASDFMDAEQYGVILSERQSGKTVLAMNRLIHHLETSTSGHYVYIAHTTAQCTDIRHKLSSALTVRGNITMEIKNDRITNLITGATVDLYSMGGSNYRTERLRGLNIDWIIVDDFLGGDRHKIAEFLAELTVIGLRSNSKITLIGTRPYTLDGIGCDLDNFMHDVDIGVSNFSLYEARHNMINHIRELVNM